MANPDTNIGKMLPALRYSGLVDDTLVIFMSDNGGERLSHNWPLAGGKSDLREGGVRVPAIVRWPGVVPAGALSAQPAITMDWTATLLAAGGAQADPDFPLDGEDLLPVLASKEAVQDRLFFWRFTSADQDAVRQGPWKYLREGEREYLLNLAEDVREQADHRELEPELLERFRSWDQTLLPKKAMT